MYDFPVTLRPVTVDGMEVKRKKAIVRTDTKEPLAIVSDVYKIINHSEVIDKAQKYATLLGAHTSDIFLTKSGSKVVAQFTYKDKTLATRTGDMVGLRVYVENSYGDMESAKLRIGGLVLKCLNGMVMPKDMFLLNVTHKGDTAIQFPEPEDVLITFENSVHRINKLTNVALPKSEYLIFGGKGIEAQLVPEKILGKIRNKEGTAWDLYNDFTYYVTHDSTRSTAIGKLNRLGRISNWFEEQFNETKIH